jgi:hypothetical protein
MCGCGKPLIPFDKGNAGRASVDLQGGFCAYARKGERESKRFVDGLQQQLDLQRASIIMSGKDPHDWLRKSTPFSRLINPELHAKPNLTVGAIGTGIFVFVIANLAYQKYSYERKNRVNSKTSPHQTLELVLSDDDDAPPAS